MALATSTLCNKPNSKGHSKMLENILNHTGTQTVHTHSMKHSKR